MHAKLVVTVVSLIAPPKSAGQAVQVTLVEKVQDAQPVGQALRVTVVLTFSL